MACYLRVIGDFDPSALLAETEWEADEDDYWRKGDLDRKGKPCMRFPG